MIVRWNIIWFRGEESIMFDYLEKKKREKARQENMEIIKDLAIGTAIGAAIGVGIGLLLAPKSGQETRGDILDLVKDAKRDIEDEIKEKSEATKKWKAEVDKSIKTSIEEIKYKADKIKDEPIEEEEKEKAIAGEAREVKKE